MDTQRIEHLISVYRDGLLRDVLPFWLRHCVDREHGGFMMALGRDGRVLDTDKGMWQQGRFCWLLGWLYNHVERIDPAFAGSRDEWLALCKHGIEFLDQYGFDPADGRMWFQVTRQGRPLRKRRYAFSESFAAIAYGEYARATGSAAYAEKAARTLQAFIDHNTVPGRAAPKFTDERPAQSIGFPMITIVSAQELRESIGWSEADAWIDRSIEAIRRYFLKEDLQVVMETVGPNGEIYDHFDGRMLTPGHAIEAAWFILREGKHRGDAQLIAMGRTMLDWMWRRGWDEEFGGLLYYVDLHGLPVQEYWHDMKFWWPHNEAVIATLLANQLTGDPQYAAWHEQIHEWTHRHFPDPEHGEWFGYLHRDGRLSVPLKGNLWKGPFHIPRMQAVCWDILQEMQSGVVQNGGTSGSTGAGEREGIPPSEKGGRAHTAGGEQGGLRGC
jgi:N-acylglucosamine 2-epimerase